MSQRKIAIIVVGEHEAGKSKTIRKYLKPMLGIGEDTHKFMLGDGRRGYILSQTFEERKESIEGLTEKLKKYENYDVLILPVRPKEDKFSFYEKVRKVLTDFGFEVKEVKIEKEQKKSYYESKAGEIYRLLGDFQSGVSA